ncbi:GtrA family protein [Pseudomonas sp. DC3000-4b1]|uniref:GtrA family protein n=1 Tax=unclassified Pseudomonas TaxID=196821 RepID=UPI003CF74DC2
MQALLSREFLIFIATGGIAAAVNFFSRILISQWFGFSIAIVLAYLCGMVTAFVLFRLFVFKRSTTPLHHSALWFTLVNAVAVIQTWAVSMLMYRYVVPVLDIEIFQRELSHAVGIIVPVFSSYLGHRHFTFKS